MPNLYALSPKALYEVFGSASKKSKVDFYALAKRIKEAEYEAPGFESTYKWIQSCYNMPFRSEIRMEMLNELLEGFGTEEISGNETKSGCRITYINFGDPYFPTVIFCNVWKYPYRIAKGGWGNYIK